MRVFQWYTKLRLYLGPQSPLGPGLSGFLSIGSFALVMMIIAPIFIKITVWWWSKWLP